MSGRASQREGKLRLNCFLVREDIGDPELALRADYRPTGKTPMHQLSVRSGVPPGMSAYLRSTPTGQPKWARRLSAVLDGLQDLVSISHRLVIFLPVSARYFAVCFGYASGALDWNAVETGFGLRLAARTLSSDQIRELKSRRFDVKARTQSVQVPGGGSLRDMDVELEGEFVFRLAGNLENLEIDTSQELDLGINTKGAIIAGDSIAFQANVDLASIQRVLNAFLSIVSKPPLTDTFAFIDALEPLKGSDNRREPL